MIYLKVMNLKQYNAPNFYLTEFIPKQVYDVLGDRSVCLMDSRLFVICQVIRNYVNTPVTINNWFDGGSFNESGFRVYGTNTGEQKSWHKLGKAADGKWDYTQRSISDVVKYIEDNKYLFRALGLGGIGVYKTFLHLDVRPIDNDKFVIWKG